MLESRASLIAVCLLWTGLRAIYWNGYYTEDSPGYVSDAIAIARGTYQARYHVNGLNVGTYAPAGFLFAMFGKSERVLSLWPLCASLIGLLSAYGFGAILFGRRAAVLAALLYAVNPGDVFFSTVVMPDAIQAGMFSLSLYLVAAAFTRGAPARWWWLLAAGAAAGVCHLVRANGIFLAPALLGATLLLSRLWQQDAPRTTIRAGMAFVLGLLGVGLAESLAYAAATGDVLHRLHVVGGHYGSAGSIDRWGLNVDPAFIPGAIFAPLDWARHGTWGMLTPDQAHHALLFTWATVASIAALLAVRGIGGDLPSRTRAGFLAALTCLAWPLLYHQFGTQSLGQFVPMHRLSRHLVVYAPAAIATVVGACRVLGHASRLRGPRSNVVAAAVLGSMLAAHVYVSYRGIALTSATYHASKSVYVRVRDHLPPGTTRIVADTADLGILDFWLNGLDRPSVTLHPFAAVTRCDDLAGAIVLTGTNPGWHQFEGPVVREAVDRLPCLTQPPASWRLLYEGFPEKVYAVGAMVAEASAMPGSTAQIPRLPKNTWP